MKNSRVPRRANGEENGGEYLGRRVHPHVAGPAGRRDLAEQRTPAAVGPPDDGKRRVGATATTTATAPTTATGGGGGGGGNSENTAGAAGHRLQPQATGDRGLRATAHSRPVPVMREEPVGHPLVQEGQRRRPVAGPACRTGQAAGYIRELRA